METTGIPADFALRAGSYIAQCESADGVCGGYEEFDAIWEQLLADCEGPGAQEIIEWRLADPEGAMKIRDSPGE